MLDRNGALTKTVRAGNTKTGVEEVQGPRAHFSTSQSSVCFHPLSFTDSEGGEASLAIHKDQQLVSLKPEAVRI